MTKDIFEKRESMYPLEYPDLLKYADAIHENFWTVEHFTYDRDVLDFKVNLSKNEQDVVKKVMLAIAVVENKVKSFWSRIDMRMPKTEIADVGYTFGSNESIHRRTYEKLLILLGLEKDFEKIDEIDCMRGRTAYLTKYLQGINSRSNKEFTKSLILFTLLIENTSLFSQFLIMSSFNKYKNVLSNFNTVIGATASEEMVHGNFGAHLINIIRQENPEWFDDEMERKIRRSIAKAFKAECEVLDWIFEKGELDFLSKNSIIEFMKDRFNQSLAQIAYKPQFEVDQELLEPTLFLERSLKAAPSFDFFNQKSTEYSKTKEISEDSLWD